MSLNDKLKEGRESSIKAEDILNNIPYEQTTDFQQLNYLILKRVEQFEIRITELEAKTVDLEKK